MMTFSFLWSFDHPASSCSCGSKIIRKQKTNWNSLWFRHCLYFRITRWQVLEVALKCSFFILHLLLLKVKWCVYEKYTCILLNNASCYKECLELFFCQSFANFFPKEFVYVTYCAYSVVKGIQCHCINVCNISFRDGRNYLHI